ncbi:hypothetical protein [Actinomadura sp. NTSP31]|uniref:hypothetical protein n=1 Tax=Actinomadura sp. NTSP31 TaxID=1735447 RepID=UPI0035C0EBBF
MSNGARHGIGVVVGIIATAVISLCLAAGTYKMSQASRYGTYNFRNYHGSQLWIGAALLLAAAVVLGFVVGSRLSPVASLVPGVVFTAVGLLWMVDPTWAVRNTVKESLPHTPTLGYMNLAMLGMFFLLGVALIAASVPPSRWRARTAGAGTPRYGGPPPAPVPPPAPGAPMPMGAPQAPAQDAPWGRPPQYGQQPPAQPQYGSGAQPGGGRYGQGGAQPPAPSEPPPDKQRPPSGAVPFDNEGKPPAQDGGSGEGVGEWTQMYGGDDLRGNR